MKSKVVKLYLFIVILFGSLFFVGCLNFNNKDDEYDKGQMEILSEVKNEVLKNIPLELTEETEILLFITELRGVSISYKSSDEAIISNDGIVNCPTHDEFVDIEITFKIKLSKEDYEEKKTLMIVVRKGQKAIDAEFDRSQMAILNGVKSEVLSNIPLEVADGTDKLSFVSELNGVTISYKSSNEGIITNSGAVTHATNDETIDIEISFKIKLSKEDYEDKETLSIVVKKGEPKQENEEMIELKLSEIEREISGAIGSSNVTANITLPTASIYDSTIRYESSNEEVLSSSGVIGEDIDNQKVTLSFYITYEDTEYGPYSIIVLVNNHISTNDNEYYKDIDSSLKGSSLKSALRTLITVTQTHATTYDEIKTITAKTDADPNKSGNIILFYSRVSVSARWDGGNTWNREHIWPRSKSWFQYEGAGSDIHHLRPTNPSINSSRGNKAYSNTKNSSTYVPNDVVKGDIARIVFYLLTRYPESDSYPITNVASSIKMLLEWNELDPVDNLEITRNEECYKYQGNRNPFIDYPEYADMIWGNINLNVHEPLDRYVQINFVVIEDIKQKWL